MKALSEIRHAAVILDSLIEGMAILLENEDDSRAQNSAYALISIVAEKASQLSEDLDRFRPENDPEK